MRLIFKTSSVTPDFFYVFNLILSFSTCRESFEKICAWKLLGANVLKREKLLSGNFCSLRYIDFLIGALILTTITTGMSSSWNVPCLPLKVPFQSSIERREWRVLSTSAYHGYLYLAHISERAPGSGVNMTSCCRPVISMYIKSKPESPLSQPRCVNWLPSDVKLYKVIKGEIKMTSAI